MDFEEIGTVGREVVVKAFTDGLQVASVVGLVVVFGSAVMSIRRVMNGEAVHKPDEGESTEESA